MKEIFDSSLREDASVLAGNRSLNKDYALYIEGLTVSFDGFKAVDNLSLYVDEGEIRVIIGPNGAGKTTTMKMILSLISRTAGEIEVFGQSIGTDKQYLNQIGSMIEEPSYYPNLTGYENLLVFQKILGFPQFRHY